MFIVKSDKTIMMNKGDTVRVPLFINRGTSLKPVRYSFGGVDNCTAICTPDTLQIDLDFMIWKGRVSYEGSTYSTSFIYKNGQWLADDEEVNLDEYGISLISIEVPENATINISYEMSDKVDTYINFYVWHPRQKTGNPPILQKTIYPYLSKVITYRDGVQIREEFRNSVNANGDIILHIDPVDSDGGTIGDIEVHDIPQGDYTYQLRANIWDSCTNEYVKNTLTNRLGFYMVEDDYVRDWN